MGRVCSALCNAGFSHCSFTVARQVCQCPLFTSAMCALHAELSLEERYRLSLSPYRVRIVSGVSANHRYKQMLPHMQGCGHSQPECQLHLHPCSLPRLCGWQPHPTEPPTQLPPSLACRPQLQGPGADGGDGAQAAGASGGARTRLLRIRPARLVSLYWAVGDGSVHVGGGFASCESDLPVW